MSTNTGRVYKSKDGDRLILYFKDINLIKPDKWGTCQLVEFLRQVIIHYVIQLTDSKSTTLMSEQLIHGPQGSIFAYSSIILFTVIADNYFWWIFRQEFGMGVSSRDSNCM